MTRDPAIHKSVETAGAFRTFILGWATLLFVGFVLFSPGAALAEQRFPPPEFESGHELPATTQPAARSWSMQYLDVVVLAIALGLAVYLIHKKRSRTGLVTLSIGSLAYFGFYRKGCICAIGSVQNVALALGDNGYALPLTALGFFVLPLLVALFAGRAFCAGVCPHGAIQELLLIKPVKVPSWLEHALGIVPFLYLGAGVFFAFTGATFLICRYDPFVPIFRMGGSFLMLGIGAAFLLASLFIGRPYCRFLCPYGALLKIAAVVSKWRVTITPDFCTKCRLCEEACPHGALRVPEATPAGTLLKSDRRRLALVLVLTPFLIAGFGWLGSKMSNAASRLHSTVELAERLSIAHPITIQPGSQNAAELSLFRGQQNPAEILSDARKIQRRFRHGGWLFGAWVGLVIGAKLVSLCLRRSRPDYETDRGSCFACARCFKSCPNEQARLGLIPAVAPPPQTASSKEVLS